MFRTPARDVHVHLWSVGGAEVVLGSGEISEVLEIHHHEVQQR
jgi:hypothetical protein